MKPETALKPRFASPVQTVAGAELIYERYGVATPVCGDGNAILRANPVMIARMGSASHV